MKAYVVERSDKTIRIGLKDASTTIIEPVIDELNRDSNVVFARYIIDHPDLDDPVLEVRVAEGKPEDAIKKASQAVGDYFVAERWRTGSAAPPRPTSACFSTSAAQRARAAA